MRRYTMIVKVKKEFADAVTLLLEHLARLGCNPFTTYELEETNVSSIGGPPEFEVCAELKITCRIPREWLEI